MSDDLETLLLVEALQDEVALLQAELERRDADDRRAAELRQEAEAADQRLQEADQELREANAALARVRKSAAQRRRRLAAAEGRLWGLRVRGRCGVCVRPLQYAERSTASFCSPRCREAARRLRRAGRWSRHERITRLIARCWQRERAVGDLDQAKAALSSFKAAGLPVPEIILNQLLTAVREEKRLAATRATRARCYVHLRWNRRGRRPAGWAEILREAVRG
jgi:DNA repair exonuclease SbcCD ATPase subunit